MARKPDALGVAATETIIGAGVKLKGNLAADGDMMIDGLISGTIKSRGNITIGVNAIIKADIEAASITVLGQVDGNLTASHETSIRETGRVKGNIATGTLAIAAGAIFAGTSSMTKTQPPTLNKD
jgi:cytoskeletal protein CcmA (bactofilin family)